MKKETTRILAKNVRKIHKKFKYIRNLKTLHSAPTYREKQV